ncbi:MAG: hypothetical protein AMXMBFR23_27420 [Chloroflexota bacterium]
MALNDSQRAAIRGKFEAFVRRRLAGATRLDVTELRPNPFLVDILIRGLGFDRAEQVATFIVNQRFERGAVTSMGTTLQDVARIVAGPESGSGTDGADLEVHRDGVRYFVQVKSGPVTINKDIASEISRDLNSARQRYGGNSVAILGVCYGTDLEVNPIGRGILTERGVRILAGAEFWDFLSNDKGTMDEIQSIARETAQSTAGVLTEALRRQVDALTPIIREQQGLP